MLAVKAKGIWIAFGLSAGLHAIGFSFVENLPHEPVSFARVGASVRLIRPTQSIVEKPAQRRHEVPRLNGSSSQAPTLTPLLTNQNNRVEQSASQTVVEMERSGSIFSKSIYYLDSNEVDTNSEPLSEWMLRTDGFRTIEKIAVQLTLFISDDGKLDKFEILNSSLSRSETELLVKDLALTTFKPASKDGKSVPNQKNVEIVLDPTPPTFRLPNLFNNFLLKNK
jgi:hypothetical protein